MGNASGPDEGLLQIQRQLLSEVESLKRGATPPGKGGAQPSAASKATLQRLAFLEKAVPKLEAERSELLVRATVAEEQLEHLQRHLKELTEGYQLQIMNLKLQIQAQPA